MAVQEETTAFESVAGNILVKSIANTKTTKDFLTNLGMDVVMVRSGRSEDEQPTSLWQVGNEKKGTELSYIFQNLLGFGLPKIEVVPGEYRAEVLVIVGEDTKELF